MALEQNDALSHRGSLAVGARETVSPDVPESAANLAGGFGAARLPGVWDRIAPSTPLLPILGAYMLISVVIHTSSNDEPSYLAYAKNLVGYADTFKGADFMWHGPALPGLLAPLVALHVPLEVTRILVGPALLFAAIVVFHRLVRPYLSSERAALIATYSLALYLPFFTTIGHIHVEVLATLCFTLAAFFMVRSFHGGRLDHIWAGVALAVLVLSRLEFGYVLLAALLLSGVWLLLSRRSPMARRSALATLVALLLCTPWLVYTYSLTSKPLYWGDSGGLQLYWMSAPGNIGDWHTDREAFTIPQLAAERPVLTEVNRLKPLDRDARLQNVAFQNIKNDPKHYLSNVVFNIGRLVFNSPYSFANENAVGLSPGWGLMLYAVPNALLLGLLSIAAFVAIKVGRRLGPEILPIAALTALGFAIHVPVAAYGRLLIPLVPVLAWVAIAIISPHVRLTANPGSPAR